MNSPSAAPEPTLPPDTAARPSPVERVVSLLERHRLLVAVGSFAMGCGSFLIVERHETLAQWLAVLMVVGWLLLLFEGTLGRWLSRWRWARFSPWVLRYATQNLHQETYFFCLPFLLATTTWSSGQAIVTALGIGCALCSMWDPLYYERIAARPWAMLAYHAVSMYLAALVLPPLLWHMDTTQSLALASITIGLLSVPSLLHLLKPHRVRQWLLLGIVAAALAGTSWLARRWVPPATLRTQRSMMTMTVDSATREPGTPVETISAAALREQGLCAWMAVRAPRGLQEPVFHEWIFDGQVQTRVELAVSGGSKQGYRLWSCKRNYPADPRGDWHVEAVTDAGQLIGVMRFEVTD